ncbi:MAG: type VI secretion system baseplate subunit TssG [Syntrophaceae bacterium]
MASEKRQQDTSVRQCIFGEFYRFPFFKLVDLLERLFRDKKQIGSTLIPSEEVARFSVKPGLAFPPSDVSKLDHTDSENPVSVEVAFMGLIGPSGVLPHTFNELAIERVYKKDGSLVAFLNMFHHRLVSLFYLGWKKHKLAVVYRPNVRDKISSCFINLAGLGTPGLLKKMDLREESIINFFSGFFSRTVPSVSSIESSVGYFTGEEVHVDQFIERLVPLGIDEQTRIGMANGHLGTNTICGSFIWECQTKFRVNIGPMGCRKFLSFLTGRGMLKQLNSLIQYLSGIEYDFEIRLGLKREEVPICILGQVSPVPPLLGWTTWISGPGVQYDEDQHITFQEQVVAAA